MTLSSLHYDVWYRELEGDDHPDNVDLLQGIRDGFHIVDASVLPDYVQMSNYKSATCSDNFGPVESQIIEEISEGRYMVTDEPPRLVSALGAIPKSSKGVRLIHDCSRPRGCAVNDFAPLGAKVRFQSLDDAVELLQPGGYSAKVDLKSAYRSVKIHASNFPFTGLSWVFSGHDDPTFMYDTRLPFGSSLAPKIFHRLTQAVKRMMAQRGYRIVAYLDDFYIHAPTFDECNEALHTLVELLRSLGFAINWNKLDGPATRITFLGVVIDSLSFTLELPSHKLTEFQVLLQQFASRKRASLKQLQQLAGRLNWACQVVRGGRCYLRRILDLMRPLKHAHHKVQLSRAFFADIHWWIQFMSIFNGRCLALRNAPMHDVYLDASNSGAGYVFATDWGYTNWSKDMPSVGSFHINDREILAAVLAAHRWAPLWVNSRVLFHTDNITARAALRKGSARSPAIMPYLRELFWLSALFNFHIDACFIPGVLNDTPDCISRLNQSGFVPSLLNLMGIPVPHLRDIYFLFLSHMSYNTFCSLFPQIQRYIS